MHHPDPKGARVPGRPYPPDGPPDSDLAGVGLNQPVRHVHESGLPGAVLAQEGVHLARGK
jgi:hypothetical protein